MPVTRGSTPATRNARAYGPASRSAKRRPTLPKPTSAMRRTGRTAGIIRRTQGSPGRRKPVEDSVDALQAGAQILRLVAEADAQEAVHAEVVAGDDKDPLL